jgi:hypothetical protein
MMIELKASAAQVTIFVTGLALSLLVGMFLAAHLDGAPGLLLATLIAGSGLLGAAVLSQVAHDHIVISEPEVPFPTAPEAKPASKKPRK